MEAYALGFGEPFALSAEHGEGLVDLFEALRPFIDRPEGEEAEEEEEVEGGPLKLAIVGRPNAGKSTLVNKMLGEERMITGPEAGITRDSISIEWVWNDRTRAPDRHRRAAQAAQGGRQAREIVGRRYPPRDRFRRGSGVVARRDARPRSAGLADCRPGARRGPRAW